MTAKYYVEWLHNLGWTNESFPDTMIRHSKKAALKSVADWAEMMGKHFNNSTWRIRCVGKSERVIAKWTDGKRVRG